MSDWEFLFMQTLIKVVYLVLVGRPPSPDRGQGETEARSEKQEDNGGGRGGGQADERARQSAESVRLRAAEE